jgi:hypothetical protein
MPGRRPASIPRFSSIYFSGAKASMILDRLVLGQFFVPQQSFVLRAVGLSHARFEAVGNSWHMLP